MSTDIAAITARLANAFARAANAQARDWTWQPLLRLLAQGQPVTAGQLATATGHPIEEVREILPTLPSIELDAQGRVVASGISLHPTPHQFRIHGRTLHTWCALDTLIFPAILDTTATVQSPCHATGQPVQLTVHPNQVKDLDPATAVVSIVTPDDLTDVRSAFCIQVHYFISADAAQPWQAAHAGAHILPVHDAFQLGRHFLAAITTDA